MLPLQSPLSAEMGNKYFSRCISSVGSTPHQPCSQVKNKIMIYSRKTKNNTVDGINCLRSYSGAGGNTPAETSHRQGPSPHLVLTTTFQLGPRQYLHW